MPPRYSWMIFTIIWCLPMMVPTLTPRAARAQNQAPNPQQDLHYQVFQDTAAGLATEYVKDSLGNVYQLMPAGPKLPWGASRDVIAAQGQKYGFRMIRTGLTGGRVEAQIPSESVKERVARAIGAEKTATGLTAVWEIKKMGDTIYVAYTGEGSVEEAQYKIIGATVSSELGLGSAYLAGSMGVGLAGGFGVGALATWAGNNVQQAIEDGLSAWEATVEADDAVRKWKENDVRLAGDLLGRIRKALVEGNYDQARKLNQGLNKFTEDRRDLGGPALNRLADLTIDLQKAISQAEKAKNQALEDAAKRGRAEYDRQMDAYRRALKEKKDREEREKAEFDVRLLVTTPIRKPGQQGEGALLFSGGEMPFVVKGDFYGNVKKARELTFAFDTPKEPGVYGLAVQAVDAKGRVRRATATLSIEAEPKQKEPRTEVGGYPNIIRYGPCEVRLNLSGFKVTSVSHENKPSGGVVESSFLRVHGVLTGDRFTASGLCRGEVNEEPPFGGATVLVDHDNNPGTMPEYWLKHDQKTLGTYSKSFNNSFDVSRIVGRTMAFHILCNSSRSSIMVDFYLKKP